METSRLVRPRWRKDILLGALLSCVALLLPLALSDSQWLPQGYRLFAPALVAVCVGFLLARSPLPMWMCFFYGLVVGFEYSINWVADILPRAELVIRDLRVIGSWLYQAGLGQWPERIQPFANSTQHVSQALDRLWERLVVWGAAIQAGESSLDTTALKLLAVFLVWSFSLWAALFLVKRRKPMLALLPIGMGIITNSAYTGLATTYVYLFFALFLIVMFWNRVVTLETRWQDRRLDVAKSVRERSTNASLTIVAVLLAVGLFMPVASWGRAVDYFWERYGPAFERFYDDLDRAFAGRNPLPTKVATGPEGLGGHSVFSPPEFDNSRLFLVRTSDPIPDLDPEELAYDEELEEYLIAQLPKRYWRERTYDIYTGRGWNTSEVTNQEWGATDVWREIDGMSQVVTQTFTILATAGQFSFGANAMISVDEPYELLLRDSDDLAAFDVDPTRYSVVSAVPTPLIEELRGAEDEYPAWIVERYLQLPEDIPSRVVDRAEEIISQARATTRYDKARAIETYIRQYQYNLDVAPAPAGQDLVDYYLFDSQEGFCDHSASTMVAMLRAVGVAARYVSGYNQGQFDVTRGVWMVMDYNAHSWPEVYFPGIGWVEFEPTPSQRTFERPADDPGAVETPAVPAVPTVVPTTPDRDVTLPRLWWLIIPILGGALVWLLRPQGKAEKSASPQEEARAIYRRMIRMARWLGLGPVSGETPREYLASLGPALEQRAVYAAGAAADLDVIGQVYEAAVYAVDSPESEDIQMARQAFGHLRRVMFRLLFQRKQRDI